MKQEIFVYFIGTAGSGKSTLTHNFKQWMTLRGLDAIAVNLDPGAENLPYEPDVDIRDWISLKEVMDQTLKAGIKFYVCEQSKQMLGWDETNLIEEAQVVGAATLNDLVLEYDGVMWF